MLVIMVSSLVFTMSFAVTRGLINTLPQNPVDFDWSLVDDQILLKNALSMMSADDLSSIEPLLSSVSALDLHDVSSWEDLVSDPQFDSIWEDVHLTASTKCESLNLSSTDCYNDCLHYNSIPSWIPLITSNHSDDKQLLYSVIKLYSVSASTIKYFDVGNPDMCAFFDGTYCSTPAIYGGVATVMQHGCCVPGSCSVTIAPGYSGAKEGYKYLVQDFYTIFIQYAFYSVDSFFYLSGFLGTFTLHRAIKKFGDRPALYIPMSYLSRFLRLAPMMMYVTVMQMTLADQLSTGYQVLQRSSNEEVCKESWYAILFFYANISLQSDATADKISCMGQLWYIQCDMQMFLLMPFLLWIFSKHKISGLLASFIPTLVCIGIRLYYGFYYDFVANTVVTPYPAKHDGNQMYWSYFQTWTRMSVYFIAVSLAMLMIIIDERWNKKFVLKAWQYWSCLLMSAFIMLSLVVWPYQDVESLDADDRWGHAANSWYYALSRPAWSVALALMTFGFKYMNEDTENNGNGQKSVVKAFLSLEIWQPLGKLTYVMYLIHLMILPWWALDADIPVYYSVWNELLEIIGIWSVAAVIGLILWFVVERPMTNMVTLLLKWITGGGRSGSGKERTIIVRDSREEVLLGDGVHGEKVYDPSQSVMTSSVNAIQPMTTPYRSQGGQAVQSMSDEAAAAAVVVPGNVTSH